jgi:replicative DNA helicase
MSEANPILSSLVREASIDDAIELASKNLTNFGNAFLDDALAGILPNDLCLIGAKSGIGKTQLATQIASFNATVHKKNVVFVALEAEKNEIEMRLRYSIEAGLYFRDQNRDRNVHVNYRNWRLGFLTTALKRYKDEAINIFHERYANLNTVYRDEVYDINEFQRNLEEAKEWGDIWILDHLHYFDLHGTDNEHSQVSRIMKQIRSLNLYYNKPFIVIAHLRKNIEGFLPTTEDFMGSSDIGKVATVCCMIAKDPDGYDPKTGIQKTIFSIPKSRTGGLGNLCGIMSYSTRHQGYFPDYRLGRVFKSNEKYDEIKEDEYPDWAKNAEKKTKV